MRTVDMVQSTTNIIRVHGFMANYTMAARRLLAISRLHCGIGICARSQWPHTISSSMRYSQRGSAFSEFMQGFRSGTPAASSEKAMLDCSIKSFRRDLQRGKVRVPPELQPVLRKWTELVTGATQRWRIYSSFRQSFIPHADEGGSYERSDHAVWILIGANALVFGLWKVADPKFMVNNFTVSVNTVLSGRFHTLITNFFSHNDFWHLASNMLGLYFFGIEIAHWYGSRTFYLLYFAGGLFGSVGHLVYSYYIFPWLKGVSHSTYVARFVPPALGASGAVNALVVLNILLNPRRIIFIDFLFPVPAALFGAYLILKDLWGVRDVDSSVSHVGHLGGALVGVIAWARLRRHW